jgi:hypothetical protein
MHRRFPQLTAAALVAITATFSAAAAPAQASTPKPAPALTSITIAPVPVSYPSLHAVISGILQTQATATTSAEPVPGEQVSLYYFGGCPGRHATLVATATTAADGSFTASASLPLSGAGVIYAEFAGDAGYAAVTASRVDSPVLMPTRITLDPLPATVTAYSPITVTGSVQVQQPGGTWLPADCAYVAIRGNSPSTYAIPTATSADGTFTTQLTPEDTGPFQAFAEPSEYSFNENAATTPQSPAVSPAQTRVTGFGPRTSPEIAQDGLAFTGQGQVLVNTPSGPVWASQTLSAQLHFRPTGATSWTLIAAAPLVGNPFAGINGYLSDGKPAEGSWQIRTLPTPVLQGAASRVIGLPVDVRTWVNDIAITTSKSRRHLTGVLDDQPSSGPLAGQQIRLSYRLSGNRRWHYLATTATDSHGRFRFPITITGRWYRAQFPGSGCYLDATSTPIYSKK